MKFRKSASAFLAAAMLVSSVSIVAYADEDQAMKKELTLVKQRIDIPDELSEFSYNKREINGKTTYYFNWATDPEESKEWSSLSVSICENVITSYEDYNDKRWEWGNDYSFGKLSREQLLKKAQKVVEKLNPTVSKYIELDADSVNVSLASGTASVLLRRVKDGVPVSGQTGYVQLDKNTGELISYSLNWIFGAGFGDMKNAVSVEKAQEGYQKEFPVSMEYGANYDWKTKEYEPYLIYKRDKLGQIDAFTGKLATFEDSYGYYEDGSLNEAEEAAAADVDDANPATGGAASVSFTDKELDKLETESKLIKPEKMLQELKDAKIYNLLDSSEVTYSNSYYNDRLGAYVCNFSFKSEDKNYYSIDGGDPMPIEPYDDDKIAVSTGNAAVNTKVYYGSCNYNAETGEVLYYYSSAPHDYDKELASEQLAERRIKRALSRIAGKKADEFKTDDISYMYNDKDVDLDIEDKRTDEEKSADQILYGASLYSPRYVNDIPCRGESMRISINSEGLVNNYSITYYGIKYPAPDGILTEDEVYESYFEQVNYSLLYRCALHEKRVETALVYNADNELYIDAFTGKLTSFSGYEIEKKGASGYTDLENSKYKKIAEKLAMYGIRLMDEEGRLNEDEVISRNDFANLISRIGRYGAAENPEKPLTRQYAAKMLTSSKISEDVASIPGLINNKFSDVTNSKYAAYVAIADALGLMTGKNGKFRPNENITRGEALQMVYDFLSD